MFKKLIASALSATIMCTSVMLDGITDTPNVREAVSAETTADQLQYDLESSNSLGNYITGTAPKSNVNKAGHAGLIDSDKYSVTNLGFDDETGTIAVASTQPVDCELSIKFINEDTSEVALEVKTTARAGESVLTEAKADVTKLPQYYTVAANLVDKLGNPVGNIFKINTYTRFVQEMKSTDIYDFNEEQVVNFDESEETNFIVLNENTVRAESSEDENTLVSADYDNNVFVFDNIDETLSDLQEGDLFYIQPTEEDIIAVSVENVTIDGDTATISGSENIDEMFDFIKFETTTDMSNVVVDTTNSDENFIFPDLDGDEKVFVYDENKPIEFAADARKLLSYNSEKSFTVSLDGQKEDMNEAWGNDTDDSPFSFSGSIEFKSSIEFYKSWTETSFGFSLTVDFNCSFTLEGDIGAEEKNFTGSSSIASWVNRKAKELQTSIVGVQLPTSIPGVVIGVEPKLVIKLSGSLSVKVSYAPIVGFTYSTDDGFQNISQFGSDQCSATLSMEGELFIGLVINPGIELVSRKIAYASFDITAGVSVTLEGEIDVGESVSRKTSDHSSDNKVAKYSSTERALHACDVCLEGGVAFKLSFGVTVSVFEKDVSAGFGEEITIPADFLDFHIAFPHIPCLPKFGWGDCDYYKYRLTFNVYDANYGGLGNAYVVLHDVPGNTDGSGHVTYFCDPGSYRYSVEYGGKVVRTGTVSVGNSDKVQDVEVKIKVDEDGNTEISGGSVGSSTGTPITTAATTRRVTSKVTTGTLAKTPNQSISQAKQLGDNITGLAYPDGYVYIFGYGDMYDFSGTPFDNVSKIKRVVFEDQDPEKGLVITSIGNNLFYGASNLEVIYWGNDITRIGNSAFYNCGSLKYLRYGGEKDASKTFVLPTALTSIGNYAFYGCSSAVFGETKLKTGTTVLGDYAFANCAGLVSVTVPGTIPNIGNRAFSGCTGLKTAVIEEGVESLGSRMFESCTALENLTLPYAGLSLDLIGKDSYALYCNLFNSSTPTGTYSAGGYGVPSTLTTITITGGTKIPNDAFYGMKSLKTINIPDTVTTIGSRAFYNCTELTSAKLPKKLVSIGTYAFYNCGLAVFNTQTIPATVTSIGDYAFANCLKLTSITVPGTVKTLGNRAFSGCSGLKKAVIEDGVGSIGSRAFENCLALEELTLPYAGLSLDLVNKDSYALYCNLFNSSTPAGTYSAGGYGIPATLTTITITGGTKIPNDAFYGMKSLTTINIPDTVTSIGSRAFYNCTGLTAIKLPGKLTNIGSYAFYNCGLAAFNTKTLPASVTNIGDYAFANCLQLTSITVPGTVKTIGSRAFSGCSGLEKAVIEEGVGSIGSRLFENCFALKELTLPYAGLSLDLVNKDSYALYCNLFNSSTPKGTYSAGGYGIPSTLETITITGGTKIPNDAFYGMTSLKNINISDSVTSIGSRSFYNCTGLTAIKLPETLTSIGSYAFYNCGLAAFNTETIPASVKSIGDYAFANCLKLTSITVPGTVKTIGSRAFSGCSGLRTVVIKEGVESIGSRLLENCLALKSLTLPYAGLSLDLVNKDSYALYCNLFNSSTPAGTYSAGGYGIPLTLDTITITGGAKIPNDAFYGMKSLTTINISDSVTSIGSRSFYNCTGLTAIKLPETLTSIGSYAFYNCGLAAFNTETIPASVTNIGDYAFANCAGLTSITVPGTVMNIGSRAFSGCAGLEKAVIEDGVGSIGSRLFENCFALKELTLPYAGLSLDLVNKDSYALYCNLFNSSTPSGTYSAGGYGIPSTLETITITGGTRIPNDAFYGMKSLKTINIPGTVKSIGSRAFYNCTGLEAIELPESIESIGSYAFYNCGLAEFNTDTIPSSVTNIGDYAFANCLKLTSITVPGTVKTIGSRAFSGCAGLETVVIEEGVESIGSRLLENCLALESLTLPYAGLSLDLVNKDSYALYCNLFNSSTPTGTYSAGGYGIPLTLETIIITGGSKIPADAFYGMKSLTNVTIPDTVTSVGNRAFQGCTGLTDVYVNNSESNWENVIIGSNNDPLLNAVKHFRIIVIEEQPADDTVISGDRAEFMVEATGDVLKYLWQYSTDNGETWKNTWVTTPGLFITVTEKQNNFLYRCIITDKYGSVEISDPVKLTIEPSEEAAAAALIMSEISSVEINADEDMLADMPESIPEEADLCGEETAEYGEVIEYAA